MFQLCISCREIRETPRGKQHTEAALLLFPPPPPDPPTWLFQVGVSNYRRAEPILCGWILSLLLAATKTECADKMMEEISIVMAYDSHVFSQLYEEDFLASLVAISKPKYVVGA